MQMCWHVQHDKSAFLIEERICFRKCSPGVKDARAAAATPPKGVTPDTLRLYREIARRQIANGMDKSGLQTLRFKLCHEAIKAMTLAY
jgi:hypothetical protein